MWLQVESPGLRWHNGDQMPFIHGLVISQASLASELCQVSIAFNDGFSAEVRFWEPALTCNVISGPLLLLKTFIVKMICRKSIASLLHDFSTAMLQLGACSIRTRRSAACQHQTYKWLAALPSALKLGKRSNWKHRSDHQATSLKPPPTLSNICKVNAQQHPGIDQCATTACYNEVKATKP